MMWDSNILIIGAGDRGTATALRLFKSGFRPVLIEKKHPTDLNYNRNFSDTVYLGEKEKDGITSTYIFNEPVNVNVLKEINEIRKNRKIPILSCDNLEILLKIEPTIIIDCAGSFPQSPEIDWKQFPCVIRIGSKFNVGVDGHTIIGDQGTSLGKVFSKPNDQKKEIFESRDIITSPLEGVFIAKRRIGDRVSEKDVIGIINDIQILSPSIEKNVKENSIPLTKR